MIVDDFYYSSNDKSKALNAYHHTMVSLEYSIIAYIYMCPLNKSVCLDLRVI